MDSEMLFWLYEEFVFYLIVFYISLIVVDVFMKLKF